MIIWWVIEKIDFLGNEPEILGLGFGVSWGRGGQPQKTQIMPCLGGIITWEPQSWRDANETMAEDLVEPHLLYNSFVAFLTINPCYAVQAIGNSYLIALY